MSLEEMRLMHENKTYPPRVIMKMSVLHENPSYQFIIPIKVEGCAVDEELNVDLLFTNEGIFEIIQY